MTIRGTSCSLAVVALFLFSLAQAGFAQANIPPSVTVVPAIRTVFSTTNGANPQGVAFDAAGNMYLPGTVSSNFQNHGVGVVSAATGQFSAFAGGGASLTQEGISPTSAKLTGSAVKLDAAGNVYIADAENQAVRVVNMQASAITLFGQTIQAGRIQTVAGTPGSAGFDSSHLNGPSDIALDGAGNLWIADRFNYAIRKVAPNGTMTTVAGQGPTLLGGSGDGSAASAAKLSSPSGLSMDSQGNLYIVDSGNCAIRAINTNTSGTHTVLGVSIAAGNIATVAGHNGSCSSGFNAGGDNTTATNVFLVFLQGITVDAAGNLWITQSGTSNFNNNFIQEFRVRFVNAVTGNISTVAGNGSINNTGDGGPATSATVIPINTALDGSGNLYIASSNSVRQISTGAGFPVTLVGNTSTAVNVLVQLNQATNLTSLAVSTPSGGSQEFFVGTVSGCAFSSDGLAVNPSGAICTIPITFRPAYPGTRSQTLVLTDLAGNQYPVGLSGVGLAPQVALIPGIISTVAGGGSVTASSTLVPAATVALGNPTDVAFDNLGNMYIADAGKRQLLKVSNGSISVFAPGLVTQHPVGVVFDNLGNAYVADNVACTVQKIAAGTGAISTIAGFNNSCGASGDGGFASSSGLLGPVALAVDGAGNIYIADYSRVRKITVATGGISTVAGNGGVGFSGDGGPATQAMLSAVALAVDPAGNIYITDQLNCRVRKIAYNTGTITTVVGVGGCGDLNGPAGLAVDAAGNLYISGENGNSIYKLDAASGTLTTLAGGTSAGFSGDGGAANIAALNGPSRVKLDPAGNLYFVDQKNVRVRTITASAATVLFPTTQGGATNQVNLKVSNIGNQNLTFSNLATASNPASPALFSQGLGSGADCSAAVTPPSGAVNPLLPGSFCYVDLFFQLPNGGPTGVKSGTTAISDNNLNNNSSTQNVSLLGTAVGNTPALAITKSHGGSNFALGQNNASYIVTVSNGATAAPLTFSPTNPVTVTENLPTGLTLVSMSGNFWSCTGNVCTRASILNSGASFPPITVLVNVASNAPASVTNSVTVTGGGSAQATATDPTTITQIQTSTLSAGATTGGPGFVVRVPLTLALTSGISMDTLNFGVVITPGTGAPALTVATTFVMDASLSVTATVSSGAANQLGAFIQTTGSALTGTLHLGDLFVTVPATAVTGQSYSINLQGTGGALAGVTVPLNAIGATLGVAQYLVGDVFPATGDSVGAFGDNSVNSLDLLAILRAVVQLPGYTPQNCSDRFDAMDVYPADTTNTRGGDGFINTLDLLAVLRKVTNVDTTRPARASRGISCVANTSSATPQAILRPAEVRRAGATSAAPVLAISKSHGGSNFALGQNNAVYIVSVSNGTAGAPTAGTVTVTDTLPTGLTLVSMIGNGWSCTSNTCTRSDVLNNGASYPPIYVTVNVAANASASVTNSVTVSGGGSASATATDATTITQTQTSVLTAGAATGGGGGVVHVPLTLTLSSGISMDTLNFGVVVTPSSGAPTLVSAITFTADSSLSLTVNTAPGAVNQLGVLIQSSALTGTLHLGDLLVTVPATAVTGQTYSIVLQGTGGTLSNVIVPLNATNGTLTVATYQVGDIFPSTGDAAGEFGDNSINTLDLLNVLRVVVNLGPIPLSCSDRFDAMDVFPADNGNTRGGDGFVDTRDLLAILRKVTNTDTTRPARASRGLSCIGSSLVQKPVKALLAGQAEGELELVAVRGNGNGKRRLAVYLRAVVDLDLSGIGFSLGTDAAGKLSFIRVSGQEPSIVDNAIPGKLAVAWVEGSLVHAGQQAGQRILLGYVDASAGTPAISFYGVSANAASDGRAVAIGLKNEAQPAAQRRK